MKQICSINGEIKPQSEATINLSQIESQYGFGVYETVKLRNNILYFVEQHIDRLFYSAEQISLIHALDKEKIKKYIEDFVTELQEDSCNLKILLYGDQNPNEVKLILLASAPFYPNRKWYREGVTLMSYQYERWMPQAKSLNMIASYYIYKKAQQKGCYDSLLYNRDGNILEGTRTNIYLIKDKNIYSAPKEQILEGVTMMSLEKVLAKSNFNLIYKSINIKDVKEYDGMFITSTSSKIVPVKQVDNDVFNTISPEIMHLIELYDSSLEKSKGKFEQL